MRFELRSERRKLPFLDMVGAREKNRGLGSFPPLSTYTHDRVTGRRSTSELD